MILRTLKPSWSEIPRMYTHNFTIALIKSDRLSFSCLMYLICRVLLLWLFMVYVEVQLQVSRQKLKLLYTIRATLISGVTLNINPTNLHEFYGL